MVWAAGLSAPDRATAAAWYAGRMRYPVSRGAWLAGPGACSCGDSACQAPGAHPLLERGRYPSSRDPGVVQEWWGQLPQASIVVPTSREFEVLDVPAGPGREALSRLISAGHWLGPVAETDTGRLWIFVQVGSWLLHELVYGNNRRYRNADLRYHAEGSCVPLPPSPGVRWVHPPEFLRRTLPSADDLLRMILNVCHEYTRTPVTVPVQRFPGAQFPGIQFPSTQFSGAQFPGIRFSGTRSPDSGRGRPYDPGLVPARNVAAVPTAPKR